MRLFGEGDLVFDIGACVGEFTGYYLDYGATVVAVEPETRSVAILKEKFKDDKRVVIVPKAVGAREGRLLLAVSEGMCTVSSFVYKQFWGAGSPFEGLVPSWMQETSVTTLDKLIEEYGRPQYCKVDTEGYESWVLEGLSTPIPFLQFEFGSVTVREGWTDKCVNRVLEISPDAEFSYCSCEPSPWDWRGEWMAAGDVLNSIDIELVANPLFWGNIVVDMRKDC